MSYRDLCQQVLSAGYFDQHQAVLVAVSGGFDSMNLLKFLLVSRETLGIRLGIAHVNHQQRPESNEEEAVLRQMAREHDLPIYVGRFEGVFSEAAARRYRYAFFEELMVREGYTALVTAHHADDQAETLFFRLLRGSRLRHLAGMAAVRPFGPGQLIRPFLSLPRKALPEVGHFEDSSNQSPDYARNRIRQTYLPLLRQENPQLDRHLVELAQETATLFQAFSDLTKGIEVTALPIFLKQSPAVQTLLFQTYLEGYPDLALTKAQFEEVLHILRTKSNHQAPLKAGYQLVKTRDRFEIRKIQPQTDVSTAPFVVNYGDRQTFGDYQLTLTTFQEGRFCLPLPSTAPVLVRLPQPGDRLNLGGFHKKLSRLFIDYKLPLEDRREALVFIQEGEIQGVLAGDRTYLRKAGKRAIMKASLIVEKRRLSTPC